MKPETSRRLFLVGSLGVAAVALGWISAGGMAENLVYYWGVSELVAKQDQARGAVVRLGGMVEEGSVEWQADENVLAFEITDGDASFPVRATGAPPQMFREGIGVVLEGNLNGAGVFETDRLMVKHSNEYKEPDADMSAEERRALYDSVLEGSG